MISDHVIGDTKHPRQRDVMLGAVAAPRMESTDEHLRREIVPGHAPDPTHHVASHRQPVPLVKPGEQRRLIDRPRKQLGVG